MGEVNEQSVLTDVRHGSLVPGTVLFRSSTARRRSAVQLVLIGRRTLQQLRTTPPSSSASSSSSPPAAAAASSFIRTRKLSSTGIEVSLLTYIKYSLDFLRRQHKRLKPSIG